MRKIMEELEDCPVIAAVKDEKGLEECLNMDVGMVFVLYGTVCTISEIVKRIKDQGKIAVVHIDLIQGLSRKRCSSGIFEDIYPCRWYHYHETSSYKVCKRTGDVHCASFFCN